MRVFPAIVDWFLNNGLSLIAITISIVSLRISVRNKRHDIALEGSRLKSEVMIALYDAQYRLKEAQDRIKNSPALLSECSARKQKMLSETTTPLLERTKHIYEGIRSISTPPHPTQMHTLLTYVNETKKIMETMESNLDSVVGKCAACVENRKACIEVVSS